MTKMEVQAYAPAFTKFFEMQNKRLLLNCWKHCCTLDVSNPFSVPISRTCRPRTYTSMQLMGEDALKKRVLRKALKTMRTKYHRLTSLRSKAEWVSQSHVERVISRQLRGWNAFAARWRRYRDAGGRVALNYASTLARRVVTVWVTRTATNVTMRLAAEEIQTRTLRRLLRGMTRKWRMRLRRKLVQRAGMLVRIAGRIRTDFSEPASLTSLDYTMPRVDQRREEIRRLVNEASRRVAGDVVDWQHVGRLQREDDTFALTDYDPFLLTDDPVTVTEDVTGGDKSTKGLTLVSLGEEDDVEIRTRRGGRVVRQSGSPTSGSSQYMTANSEVTGGRSRPTAPAPIRVYVALRNVMCALNPLIQEYQASREDDHCFGPDNNFTLDLNAESESFLNKSLHLKRALGLDGGRESEGAFRCSEENDRIQQRGHMTTSQREWIKLVGELSNTYDENAPIDIYQLIMILMRHDAYLEFTFLLNLLLQPKRHKRVCMYDPCLCLYV